MSDELTPYSSNAPSYGNLPPDAPERLPIREELRDRLIDRYLAQQRLDGYRSEPLFDSSDEEEEEKEKGPSLLERLKNIRFQSSCARFPSRHSALPKPSFEEVLRARKDDLLRADRERGEELRKERRKFMIEKAVKEQIEDREEEHKRARRIENRWHQLRYAEEDRLRAEYIREQLEEYYPGVELDHQWDSTHLNLNRRWEGFELGKIGRNNTTEIRSVIPSLPELLYPQIPQPWKATTEPEKDENIMSNPLVPPPVDREITDEVMINIQQLRNAVRHLEHYGGVEVGTERHRLLRELRRKLQEAEQELGKLAFEHYRQQSQLEVEEGQEEDGEAQEGEPVAE